MSQKNQGSIVLWLGLALIAYHFFGWLGFGVVLAVLGIGMVMVAEDES